jgi:hypothetical protein
VRPGGSGCRGSAPTGHLLTLLVHCRIFRFNWYEERWTGNRCGGIIVKRSRKAKFIVAAARQDVIDAATNNPYLIANWTSGYEKVGDVLGADGKTISIKAANQQRGRCVEWSLTVVDAPKGNGATAGQTEVTILVTEKRKLGWRLWDFYWQISPLSGPHTASVRAGLGRLEWKALAPDHVKMSADAKDFGNLVTLLNVYTTQFGSYTTLLWQVPALGLTAQAFLLMIALGPGSSDAARYTAAALSVIIAVASWNLMHYQRGRAINQAELAKRVSYELSLQDLLGGFQVDDGIPTRADAVRAWAVDHAMYTVWRVGMALFALADAAVIISTIRGDIWFNK